MIRRYSDHVTNLEKMANSPEQLHFLMAHKLKSLMRRSGAVHVASAIFTRDQRFDMDGEELGIAFDSWHWTGRHANSRS